MAESAAWSAAVKNTKIRLPSSRTDVPYKSLPVMVCGTKVGSYRHHKKIGGPVESVAPLYENPQWNPG